MPSGLQTEPPAIIEELSHRLRFDLRRLGRLGSLPLACPLKPAPDNPLKLLVRLDDGRVVAFAKCSSQVAPDAVAREMEIARRARELLNEELGRVVLEPLLAGEVDGRSFAVLPYCQPLSDSSLLWVIQRRWVRRLILDWLFCATCVSIREADDEGIDRDFRWPLMSLMANPALSPRVRDEASKATKRLERGLWRPKYVLAHNDFRKGNVLLQRSSRLCSGRFTQLAIIDWGGAVLRGHAIYDLIAIAKSLRLSKPRLQREVARHCQALGVPPDEAKAYLLAGLGHLGLHLNYFPQDRYLSVVEGLCQTVLDLSAPRQPRTGDLGLIDTGTTRLHPLESRVS